MQRQNSWTDFLGKYYDALARDLFNSYLSGEEPYYCILTQLLLIDVNAILVTENLRYIMR